MKPLSLLVAVMLVSVFGFAQAPPCPSGTLANVIGTSCSIGNLTFNFQNNFQGAVVTQDIFGNVQTTFFPPSAIGFTPVQTGNQVGFLLTANFFDNTNGSGLIFSQHNSTFSYGPQVDGAFEMVGEGSTVVGNITDVTPSSSDAFFAFDGRCFNNGQCMAVQPIVGPHNSSDNHSVTSALPPALAGITSPTGFTTEIDSFAIGGGEATLNSALFLYTVVPQKPLPPPANLQYQNIDLAGEQSTFAEAINNQGQIVGVFQDFSGVSHGYVTDRVGASPAVIDFPGAAATEAFGINNQGDIVGIYIDNAGVTHGFQMTDGSLSTLDFPNSIFTVAAEINDQGAIAGYYENADGSIHGYVFQDGSFTTIDDPDAPVFTGPNNTPITQTELFSINGHGDVAGISLDGNGIVQSFVLSHGVFRRIAVLAGLKGTQVASVNNSFVILGAFIDVNPVNNGFLLRGDTFTTVDFPGAANTFPSTINNQDSIVGFYSDSTGAPHSFLAQPGNGNDAGSADASVPVQSATQNESDPVKANTLAKPCIARQPMLKTGVITCLPLR